MKILHTCIATQKFMPRFLRTCRLQDELFPQVRMRTDQLLVTDHETDLSGVTWPVLRANLRINGIFNHSRARNIAMEHALKHGYDYMLDGDSTRLIAELPDVWPEPGLSSFRQHVDKLDSLPYDLKLWWERRQLTFSKGSAFYIFSRLVLERARFCEDYVFTRWEDRDFVFVVCPDLKVPIRPGVGAAIHLWHPHGQFIKEVREKDGNRALYDTRVARFLRSSGGHTPAGYEHAEHLLGDEA